MEPIGAVLWLSWHPLEPLFVPVWAIAGGLSGLSLVDPELAFRYENVFQLRDVELSSFGVFLQVGGGILALVLFGVYILARPSLGFVSVLAFYGSAVVALSRHWPPAW